MLTYETPTSLATQGFTSQDRSMLLRTLGKLKLEASDFRERQPLLPLCFLALGEKAVRSEIAELFWPDKEPEQRFKSLGEALRKLKRVLPGLVRTEGKARVHANVDTDGVVLLEALEGREFERAIEMYGGPFLSGIERDGRIKLGEEWVMEAREGYHARVREAMLVLAETHALSEGFEEAAKLAWCTFSLSVEVCYPLPDDRRMSLPSLTNVPKTTNAKGASDF